MGAVISPSSVGRDGSHGCMLVLELRRYLLMLGGYGKVDVGLNEMDVPCALIIPASTGFISSAVMTDLAMNACRKAR